MYDLSTECTTNHMPFAGNSLSLLLCHSRQRRQWFKVKISCSKGSKQLMYGAYMAVGTQPLWKPYPPVACYNVLWTMLLEFYLYGC